MARKPHSGLPLLKQFDAGYWAFRKGVPEGENPYRGHTMYAKEWQRGWNKAYFDTRKRVNGPRKARA